LNSIVIIHLHEKRRRYPIYFLETPIKSI